ncbi:transposable element Tcb1 transposase [Trichonephila clavipes]|nr:transposable element Tcb1 transposase [Trichonephila clavipes]
MTAQRYVHGILQLNVLPLMQRLPGSIFQQDNARPQSVRVSQKCLRTVTSLPWPARSPDLSPIEHIWDHLKIGSRVRRNQTTIMRICDHWMQEGTMDRRGRSHPPQCITSPQNFESVTHHSLSARTIRRRSQQSGLSARRPLLGLLLTQNRRHLRRQWCDERRMWVAEWNEVVFTDESRICLQLHDGRIRVWRQRGERMLNSCFMHHHTGPEPGIRGLATAIFQQDNARPHGARIDQRFVNHQIELFSWPARSPDLSPIGNMWSMVAQRLTQITPPAATRDHLWQRVEAAWSAVSQVHIQSFFESMPRRVAAVISNNGGYSGYRFWQEPHFTEVYKFNHFFVTWSTCYLQNKSCCAISCLSWCCIYGGQQCVLLTGWWHASLFWNE